MQSLASDYEMPDFISYICQSYVNGNRKQALELFKLMGLKDKKDFLTDLNNCALEHFFGSRDLQVQFLNTIIEHIIAIRLD